jgi:hypothetical protein
LSWPDRATASPSGLRRRSNTGSGRGTR